MVDHLSNDIRDYSDIDAATADVVQRFMARAKASPALAGVVGRVVAPGTLFKPGADRTHSTGGGVAVTPKHYLAKANRAPARIPPFEAIEMDLADVLGD
ncbi:MAG: hypothetical protein K9L32_06335 [Chromatiaceae bacterium]|nr:hypothetical protein [Chromatiaceae bacterium]